MIQRADFNPSSSIENDELIDTSMKLNSGSSLDNVNNITSPLDVSTGFNGPYSANIGCCNQITSLTDGRSTRISPALSDSGISMMDAPLKIGSSVSSGNGDASKLSTVSALSGRKTFLFIFLLKIKQTVYN